MAINRSMRLVLLAVAAFACNALAQDGQPSSNSNSALTAEAVMARVAVNQDRSESLRKEYVYKQHIHVVTHKPKGTGLGLAIVKKIMEDHGGSVALGDKPDGPGAVATLKLPRRHSVEHVEGELQQVPHGA